MKTVNDIRREFLDYFKDKGHTEVASSSLVPQNDPTLMFANSGMVQFKDIFTGREKREYSRATTSQKSVRAGGKHNDLENVGYTARHHTFFEMLGNFSFGDYFKEDAISFAWELVSKNFSMPKDKLLVTVHSTDEEAAELWKKIAGFSDDKIIRIPTDDNFWQMGDTGPCGPCSEIFYDQGDSLEGGPPGTPEEDGDRFLEFWNLVFMQFEQEPDGEGGHNRTPLPKPSIDTGMGLERMAALMQGKFSNYDIDLLRDIIEHSADLTAIDPDGEQAASHRVIADHLRCSAFLLADGVMPSNEGRGYVLRRIMRRGMRHAHLLGYDQPLMYKLFPTLQSKMGEAYPELKRAEALIVETLRSEEERFKNTLDRGLKLLDEESQNVKDNVLPGDIAFKLYDTYGFPLDLTQDALRAKGIDVDVDAFDACMEEQKAKARASWSGAGGEQVQKLWFEILEEHGPTEFLGYESEQASGQILCLVQGEELCKSLEAGQQGMIITNQSPFYAESGGQAGDQGIILGSEDQRFKVEDVKKQAGKLWVHIGVLEQGTLNVGDSIDMQVDEIRRQDIRCNHSVTHLLHEALRQVLGDHVSQKGSLQDADKTRFDISHPKGISKEELLEVETIVNEEIRANSSVQTRVMPLEQARESGAMALFGEKYEDEVRVVTMGREIEGANKPFSVELCGGTHVQRTGDIGLFKLINESALSAGVRRLEGLTGKKAFDYPYRAIDQLQEDLENERKKKKALEKEIKDLRRKLATGEGAGSDAEPSFKQVGDLKFSSKVLEDFPPKDLKPMADSLKKSLSSGVIALVATNEGRASLVVAVTEDLADTHNAVELVKIGSEVLGGKGGGGRADMAQAGGPNANAANDALSAIERALA